jgi:hypothetical protein
MDKLHKKPVFYQSESIKQTDSFRRSESYKKVKSFIQNSSLSFFNSNSYRLLGLSTNASEKEILEKINDLKMKSKLGLKHRPALNTNLLKDIEIDDKALLSAANRLRQPEGRLFERLFWFSNINDWPVNNLKDNNIGLSGYIDFFYKTVVNAEKTYPLHVLYNIALLGLLILNNDDYKLRHVNTWTNVYNLILFIYEQDEFWDVFDSIEANGGFVHSGKAISTNKYKAMAKEKLLVPFLALLNKHFDEDIIGAENGLQIYSDLNLEDQVKQENIRHITDKLEDDISQAFDHGLEYCHENIKRDDCNTEDNENICIEAYGNFYNIYAPKLRLFWKHAKEPLQLKRMKEKFADYLMSMAASYTWADNYIMAHSLLLDANKLIDTGSAEAVRLETMFDRVKQSAEFQKTMGITIDSVGRKTQKLNYNRNNVSGSQSASSSSGYTDRATRSEATESDGPSSYWWVAIVIGLIIFVIIGAGDNQSTQTSNTNSTNNSSSDRIIETIEYTNARYRGEVQNGEPHGHGTLTYNDGDKYTGSFQSGKFHGQGTLTWSGGNKYVGSFQNDMFHGQGTLTLSGGNKYVGSFQNDMFHGQGILTWSDGSRHDGSWAKDDAAGYGTYYFPGGDRIIGNWTDLSNATQARYYWRDGSFVNGIVRNGQFYEQ